jgi:RHS repeat-associated protein
LKYVLQDVQSSTRVVMSGNQIVARHDYLPFGEEISAGTGLRTTAKRYAAPERIRQQYAGLERDDVTGLDHSWWRKYENRAGRWTSTDPLAGSISDPQSLNRYAYVNNDPVNFVDPSGLDETPGPCPLGGCIVTVPIPRDNNPISNLPPGMIGSLTGGIRRKAPISEFEPRFGGRDREPTPQNPAPVDKGYAWWGDCNRSANDLMRTVRRDFSKFGNFSEPVAGGLGVAGIKFDSGPITQGRTIGITVGGFSTVDPSISYSRSMSVTVSSASTQSFTFTTNPGHVFYPGTISFSARDTNSGVRFGIDLKGQYGDIQSGIGFRLGGGSFEDDAWKSFLAKVRESCGHRN